MLPDESAHGEQESTQRPHHGHSSEVLMPYELIELIRRYTQPGHDDVGLADINGGDTRDQHQPDDESPTALQPRFVPHYVCPSCTVSRKSSRRLTGQTS